jgi:hypothetical protein
MRWEAVLRIRVRNEFEVKLLWKTGKIWEFLNINARLKNMNSFLSKKYSPEKLISHHNEQPNTLTRQENKDKIYVKNTRKKFR